MTVPMVRLATPADAPAIADAHVRGWQVAYRGLVPDEILDGFSVERRTSYWQHTLRTREPDDPERTWVVEIAGQGPLGFASAGPGRDESAPPPDGAGEIYAIYLAPEARGLGHGRVLFAHAVADLGARGFDPVVVWAFDANPVARRFYEAAGFRTDGTRHTIDFDGTPLDEIRYRLDARPST